jgi:hypothetical protein
MAKDPVGRVAGGAAFTVRDLELAAAAYSSWNLYVCPNPTSKRHGVRHSGADVSHWSWFLLDMDPQLPDPDPLPALHAALLWLGEWTGYDLLGNCLIIDSGRGAQAWVRLDDWPLADETARREATATNRYWLGRLDDHLGMVGGCRVDTTSSDLPRPMRCPGTTNSKTGRGARLLEPGAPHPGLARRLVTGTPPELFVPPPPSAPGVGLPWQAAVPHMTATAREFIANGWQEPGRHRAMWHTAKRLQEAGVSREEAEKALWIGNKQCRRGDGKPGMLTPEEVNHSLDTAYRCMV